MEEYRNFKRCDLEDGCVVCEDVHLASGSVCTVYFSPRSIYVLSSGRSAPEKRYREIQDLLGAVRIRLYLLDNGISGLYDPLTDSLGCEMDPEALSEDVSIWLGTGRVIYAPSAIERMISLLKSTDIYSRGYAVQDDGEILLLRHGTFHPASPASSGVIYYLTLFGGTLGLHRFAMGKVLSGLLYLLTGGMFLSGWLLDLLQLFIGMQKDSKKRYILPLSSRLAKALMLPLGFLTSIPLFFGYLTIAEAFGLGFMNTLAHQLSNTDPHFFENLIQSITSLFSQMS